MLSRRLRLNVDGERKFENDELFCAASEESNCLDEVTAEISFPMHRPQSPRTLGFLRFAAMKRCLVASAVHLSCTRSRQDDRAVDCRGVSR
ncbi:hypothetical protein [Bradyrhizobium sp. CER78]|uniref:hypothetical protein n=1 Tax=Bradyrhizobium sp. CER78 TaxID=3039162 RepID=UPI00244A5D1E|nr:hypothetical protein [Bradyrhizobium sp. CER78]MDH2384377.1 hypothetical protein [Bradyrhizobium sp. CER78]